MKRRLLWQIYPAVFVITAIGLFAISWNVKSLLRTSYENEKKISLERVAKLSLSSFATLLDDHDLDQIQQLCTQKGEISQTRFTVINPQGKVLGYSNKSPLDMVNHFDRPEFQTALTSGKTGSHIRPSETLLGIEMMYVAVPVIVNDTTIAVLRTSVEMAELHRTQQAILKQIIQYGVMIAVVLAVLSLAVSWKISRPLELLRRGAERFAKGDLAHRLPITKTREIGDLSSSMNQMAAQLDERIRTVVAQKNEQQAVLSSMIEGVVAVSMDGQIITINKAATEILKTTVKEAVGRGTGEVIRNRELQDFIQKATDREDPVEEQVMLPETHSERFLQTHGRALRDDQGNKIGVLIVLNDVTRIHQLEKVRQDFVANVSHELKTPITSIKGFIETLLDGRVENPEDTRRFLTIIARQTNRLNTIVDDLLVLSRIEQQNEQDQVASELTEIKTVLSAAADLCGIASGDKNITIQIDCPESLSTCVNSSLLEQAIVNLVDNAVKYSDPDSMIRIEAAQDADQLHISVHDQGCGITEEHLPRLFERFYRVDKARSRKLGGTGLGLAIVKHIVQSHKGSVTVESTIGKGSIFTLHIPVEA